MWQLETLRDQVEERRKHACRDRLLTSQCRSQTGHSWERYAKATGLTEDSEAAVRHLWQACSDGLRRALYNEGAREIRSADELLLRAKSLCVQRRNNLVNIFTLQKIRQERDEGVLAFVARLNGQVSLCDLNVTCSCSKVVSFSERFKTLQLINGIYDKEIQEKVLAAGADLPEGGETTLSEVIKMVQSCEMGKHTHAELSKAGNINRISEHRKNKGQGRQERRDRKSGAGGQSSGCRFCGRLSGHPRDECPAKDKKCNNCGIVSHFATKCRRPKDKGKAKVAEVSSESTAAVSTLKAEITEEDDDGDFFGEVGTANWYFC